MCFQKRQLVAISFLSLQISSRVFCLRRTMLWWMWPLLHTASVWCLPHHRYLEMMNKESGFSLKLFQYKWFIPMTISAYPFRKSLLESGLIRKAWIIKADSTKIGSWMKPDKSYHQKMNHQSTCFQIPLIHQNGICGKPSLKKLGPQRWWTLNPLTGAPLFSKHPLKWMHGCLMFSGSISEKERFGESSNWCRQPFIHWLGT